MDFGIQFKGSGKRESREACTCLELAYLAIGQLVHPHSPTNQHGHKPALNLMRPNIKIEIPMGLDFLSEARAIGFHVTLGRVS